MSKQDDWYKITLSMPAALDEAILAASHSNLMSPPEYVRRRLLEAVEADGVKIAPPVKAKRSK
jgi:hypothetical protein